MEIKNISGIVNVYNKIKLNSGKTKVAPAEKKTDKEKTDAEQAE